MKKFEYCSFYKHSRMDDDTFMEGLNVLGESGWELVAVTPDTDAEAPTAYFKREINKMTWSPAN